MSTNGSGPSEPAAPKKIFLALPTYSGEIDYSTHLTITRALGEASQRGWTVDTMFRSWDSVISRARNVLFSTFLDHTDCTDLFFLDGDIGCRPGSFARIMEHPVDVVGGAYRGKKEPEEYAIRTLQSGIMQFDPDTKLMEVEAVATGFLRITRNAAEKMKEAYGGLWYKDSTAPNDMTVYNFFDFELRNHQYWTEDYVFCRRWRDIGGKVWVDPLLELDHTGKKVFTGCLFDYLQKNCAPSAPSAPPPPPPSIRQLAQAFLDAAKPQEKAA